MIIVTPSFAKISLFKMFSVRFKFIELLSTFMFGGQFQSNASQKEREKRKQMLTFGANVYEE